jgi:type 1 glutamine amidotransferase
VITVKYADREHPVTRGLGEGFTISDELYRNFTFEPGNHVLATAFDDPKQQGTGRDEPLLWTRQYGSGRVFQTALGHDLAAMSEPGFVATFVRGSEWAATGDAHESPKPAARPRVLVVTGGHAYETSFYTLFDGFDWTHEVTNARAFREDLRGRYDAIALYDLEHEIGETARRNLEDFVRSGKGLVVLHHAVADYNGWEWWWRDVVGGKYLMKPAGGLPASDYKHDQQFVVRPVGKHPILAGIAEFKIQDEGYKRLWVSPEAKILLEVDHPEADRPLAWVGPYAGSRVACILLGHDHWAHENPMYRLLVRNALHWAAGR